MSTQKSLQTLAHETLRSQTSKPRNPRNTHQVSQVRLRQVIAAHIDCWKLRLRHSLHQLRELLIGAHIHTIENVRRGVVRPAVLELRDVDVGPDEAAELLERAGPLRDACCQDRFPPLPDFREFGYHSAQMERERSNQLFTGFITAGYSDISSFL